MTEKEILSELNAGIEHDPDRDKNYYQRGLIYKKQKLWEKAEADFAKAFSLWTDPLYLHEWREAAKEKQATQTLEERMAPYAAIINKIKDIREDAPPFDDTENVPTVELIAALALFEEYEVLKTLFKSEQFTANINETVSPAFAYWQPTPLYFITSKKALAIMKDPCKMIRFLSAHGADPNIPAEDGSTMLWNQCNKGYPIEIMKTLLEIGADPNQTSKDSEAEWTPLAYCLLPGFAEDKDGNPIENQYLPIENESIEKAKLLLDHNADANFTARDGNTAMILALEKGEVYEGHFVDGKLQGKGKYTNKSGDIYEGDFVDGKFHGKGKLTMTDAFTYEGDFENNSPHGKGKWTSLEYGDYYEGDFFNGRRHGKGKIIYADGRVYEGDWAKGRWNGKGKMIYPDGRIEEGGWKDGNFVGKEE